MRGNTSPAAEAISALVGATWSRAVDVGGSSEQPGPVATVPSVTMAIRASRQAGGVLVGWGRGADALRETKVRPRGEGGPALDDLLELGRLGRHLGIRVGGQRRRRLLPFGQVECLAAERFALVTDHAEQIRTRQARSAPACSPPPPTGLSVAP